MRLYHQILRMAFPVVFLTFCCVGYAQITSTSPAVAPPQRPVTTLQVKARLVVLDAVAIDAQGNVIRDLKKEDFHITEQKQPQIIRGFTPPGKFNVKPDTVINSTADLDTKDPQAPVNIVVLDEFNTLYEDMAFARYSLKKLLESQPDMLTTPTMLCAVTLDKFTVLKDYTRDKVALLSALDRHLAAYPWQVQQFSWVMERYEQAFATLSRVAEASVGHPGHKTMIWIGRGLPTLATSGFRLDDNLLISAMVQRTVNELRDARITLYTVDPAGRMIYSDKYGEEDYLFAMLGGDPNFERIALATGGRAMHGSNDVDAQIGSAMRDGAAMYTLAHQPTERNPDETKFRAIKVTVDRPGVKVYTRQGYYLALPPVRSDPNHPVDGELAGELLAASHSNMAYDAVHFSVTSSASSPGTLQIHLNPETIIWYYVPDGSKPRWMVALLVISTFDRKNKPMEERVMKLAVAAPAGMKQDGGKLLLPVDQIYTLADDPTIARVRLVVRMEANGRMGTVDFIPGNAVHASSFGANPGVTANRTPATAP